MKSNNSQYTIEGLIPGPSAFCFLSQNVISTHDQFSDMVVTCIIVSIKTATEAFCRSINVKLLSYCRFCIALTRI